MSSPLPNLTSKLRPPQTLPTRRGAVRAVSEVVVCLFIQASAKKHPFYMSLGHSIQQQKLLSSPCFRCFRSQCSQPVFFRGEAARRHCPCRLRFLAGEAADASR